MNVKKNKTTKLCVEVKSFYNKHFPTDRKTYNWRLPFIGLVLSLLSMHFVAASFVIVNYTLLLPYIYIFVAAPVGYELHYGLKIGDRKQYTPWLILKLIEMCLTLASVIYVLVEYRRYMSSYAPAVVYGFVILTLNGLITYVVGSMSLKQLRGHQPKENIDENVYDNYDNVDNFSDV
jgi:hypothetical protein